MFVISSKVLITSADREYPYYITTGAPSLSEWKKIPQALNYTDLAHYVHFLKTRYNEQVSVEANHSYIPNRVTGSKISFKTIGTAKDLLKLLNRS